METNSESNIADGAIGGPKAEIDETAHLLSTGANRERLLRAIADVEAGRNLVSAPSGVFE